MRPLGFLIALATLTACGNTSEGDPPLDGPPIALSDRWASSEDLSITINSPTRAPAALTQSGNDFKPSWSADGRMLTFFRAYQYGANFKDWRTRLCVINADGTGFRELTSGQYPDFNPTWTRDGSNRIVFNRYSRDGGWHNQVFWTTPDAQVGDEQLVSDPAYPDYEWVTGALRDGPLFVDRISSSGAGRSFLLTPNPGRAGRYEEVQRPSSLLWHKLTLSPSETRVAYMLDHDGDTGTYQDVSICWARFDVAQRRIYDEVTIAAEDRSFIREYPLWSRDESMVLYDANRSGPYQLYAYRLAGGTTHNVSPSPSRAYQFACFEGMPK